jgi:hypothetical protein
MHDLLLWYQNLPPMVAIAEGETVWAYPTILMLHTVGLGWLVGLNTVVALRLLGVGRSVPLDVFQELFPKMWWGFWLNLVTGVVLFSIDADHKAYQWVYWVKLTAVTLAMVNLVRTRQYIEAQSSSRAQATGSDGGRGFAWVALVLWAVATTAGRMMAYVG